MVTIAGSQTGLVGASAASSDWLQSSTPRKVYVANKITNSVSVFTSLQTGNVAPAYVIQGSNTKLNHPSSIAGDVAYNVWVTNAGAGSVEAFGIASFSGGNTAPLHYFSGANTTLVPGVTGIAYEQRTFSIFVCNTLANAIVSFPYYSSGNVAPSVTIAGPLTGLNQPDAIVIDDSSGLIYVANASNGSITVYAGTASGNVAPVRTIAGPATMLTVPIAIGVRYTRYRRRSQSARR